MEVHNAVDIVAAVVLAVLVGAIADASPAPLYSLYLALFVVVDQLVSDIARDPDPTSVHVAPAAIAVLDADVSVFEVVVVAGSLVIVVVAGAVVALFFDVVVVVAVANLGVEVVEYVRDTEDTRVDEKADHMLAKDDGESYSSNSERETLLHS